VGLAVAGRRGGGRGGSGGGVGGRRGRRRRRWASGGGEARSRQAPAAAQPPPPAHASAAHATPARNAQREVQGGVGKRTFPWARSSGQTTTFFSFCHWKVTALWASWNPS